MPPTRDTDIPWPLSMRWPLAFWRGIFAPTPSDFVANPQVDLVLERGRYLVEGLGHCGACHTPAQSDDAGKSAQRKRRR